MAKNVIFLPKIALGVKNEGKKINHAAEYRNVYAHTADWTIVDAPDSG